MMNKPDNNFNFVRDGHLYNISELYISSSLRLFNIFYFKYIALSSFNFIGLYCDNICSSILYV